MSQWRQKGFVQDSDEDDEDAQLDSQRSERNAAPEGRVEHVDIDEDVERDGENIGENALQTLEIVSGKSGTASASPITAKDEKARSPTARRFSPRRPTASPLTPVATSRPVREPTESPDPLQNSPVYNPLNHRRAVRLQRPGSPSFNDISPPPGAQQQDESTLSSHMRAVSPAQVEDSASKNAKTNLSSNILGAFGVDILSDGSDDESLSEPPSVLNSPEDMVLTRRTTEEPLPHRRTAVQVVIPSSTALQKGLYEEEARREFRQRKPIQLHPYALEGELYRREVQSRGLKPVPRPRSPEQRVAAHKTETQEKDFDPNEAPDSSPPEPEILVSTPIPRRPRADKPQGSSTRLRASGPARRRLSATQPHRLHAAKRRKLNVIPAQAAAASTSIFDNDAARCDIWSIPPNSPPYSSSPHLLGRQPARTYGMNATATPAPNLPTPSTSSIFQDEPPQLLDSDNDQGPRSTRQVDSAVHRPTRIVLSDLSTSNSESSSSEAEHSDHELRQVSRKIKGVLPASWLRFDQQAQERRQAQARERERARELPELSLDSEPQRGVAQRVLKRNVVQRPPSGSITPAKHVVVISDGSENDLQDDTYSHSYAQDAKTSVQDATALAAAFDRKYADDDSDNMENDRLHLFTLGGTGSKRKTQTRLTDAFGQAKRMKATDGRARKLHVGHSGKRQHNNRQRSTKRTPPPALSIIDVELSPPKQGNGPPQFLRLARRQALRRPDLARQNPRMKQIRLHNARDTEEANTTLQEWRTGGLRPKNSVTPRRPKNARSALLDRTDNQQYTQPRVRPEEPLHKDPDAVSEGPTTSHSDAKLMVKPYALEVFQRTGTQRVKTSQRTKLAPKLNQILQRSNHTPPVTFRAGQLESDERIFGHGHRKIAFEKGLRHAERPIAKQGPGEYMNTQLARFLADDDAALPPLPSATDIGEEHTEFVERQIPPRKRRVRKKMQVRRVDVDAREFRQPSEQAVQEILTEKIDNRNEEAVSEEGFTILQGLGPFGTRYPTAFDVTPLQVDTYFHSSTFVGSEDLRRALSVGHIGGRELDELAGYCIITHNRLSVRCGPWNDETSSALYEVLRGIMIPLDAESSRPESSEVSTTECLHSLAHFVRSLISYVSTHLSFSDPVDRKAFVVKMQQLLSTVFDRVSVIHHTSCHTGAVSNFGHSSLRVMIFLLVLSVQTISIAQNTVVDQHVRADVQRLAHTIARTILSHIVGPGRSELGQFLEQNQRHAVRQNGVRETDVVAEGVIVCMHALEKIQMTGMGFWDMISQELTSTVTGATHITAFETAWATLFSMLPFIDVDITGIPVRTRRENFSSDNWTCISTMLRRLFELYHVTYEKHGSSLNDYVRASLARCHRLIRFWHWQRPEQMLNVVFDFFGRNGLKQLRRELSSGSVAFFDHATSEQPLSLVVNECSFHIALKCLALGLRGMRRSSTEKKIRSFVFRTIPNHGRSYPKDQSLDEESLAALRNHHDLLCTLYWAAPPPCRPKLELIRGLVSHETSHREACRVNVRAWANLTAFQLSSCEDYAAAKPFALWHKDIMHQTLKQYRLAKSEADDYLKSGVLDGTTDVSVVMVRQTMERNQEQVIATLRDCIQGMRKAIQSASGQNALGTFLVDSDISHLLELPHLEDRRLVNVIRDTLALLQEYAKSQASSSMSKQSQSASADSQDYGDFPDVDDLDDLELDHTKASSQHTNLDSVQGPLWHLLSNAFGAETSPDDHLLMDCVDTWILIAKAQVASGAKSWSHYLESFSQKSWHQLRQTEQTRKFGPYFLACLVDSDRAVYEHHRHDFDTALLLSLVDRESMLRFQHLLLHNIVRMNKASSLLKNLPFFRDETSGNWDITSDTLRSRRLGLISSVLSNMRDELHRTAAEDPSRTCEVRRTYATMLQDLMTRMKSNYLLLQQGTTVTGAYVDFVQKIIQFLKQYTGDICPVIPFFTDSVAFPLPSTDPTYVVGRLCGYAPKAMEPGTAKQLSVFIQTVAQQAAADNQQLYLVNQLTTALCSEETPAFDRKTLRSVLLRGIFPAYLEKAFSSSTGFLISRPILQCLQPILDTMIFDLRITQPDSVSSTMGSILAVAHAFVRSTEDQINTPTLLDQPYFLAASTHMLGAITSLLPVLEYICSRTRIPTHPLVTYTKDLCLHLTQWLLNTEPDTIPDYNGDANSSTPNDQHNTTLAFCRKGLEDSLKANWSEDTDGIIRFGQGYARKEAIFDIGSAEQERENLSAAIVSFQSVLRTVYEEEFHDVVRRAGGVVV